MSNREAIIPTWADVPHVAKAYKLSRYRQSILIDAGEIVASKDGYRTLINLPSVDAYLERVRITRMADLPSVEEMKRRRKLGIERKGRRAGSTLLATV